MEGYHEPVLLREVIEALDIKNGSWYLDCTLGDGGHALEILRHGGNVVGIDVDPQALERAEGRLGRLGGLEGLGEYRLIQGNFRDIKNLLSKQTDIRRLEFAGAIFDLGVSSLQLEAPDRGFSFLKEGPLDMRMDPNLEVKALDLLGGLNKGELYEIFYKLGEEKNSGALANALVLAREVRLIKTTRDLAELAEKVVGSKNRGIHSATRIFQALRITVNDELNALQEGLDQAIDLVANYGHLVLISFHSLEDRIVKNTFKVWESEGLGRVVTKKPIRPGIEEVGDNPRSRSAKMRVFEIL